LKVETLLIEVLRPGQNSFCVYRRLWKNWILHYHFIYLLKASATINSSLRSCSRYKMKNYLIRKNILIWKYTIIKVSLVQKVWTNITSEAESVKPATFWDHFFSFKYPSWASWTSGVVSRGGLNPGCLWRSNRLGPRTIDISVNFLVIFMFSVFLNCDNWMITFRYNILCSRFLHLLHQRMRKCLIDDDSFYMKGTAYEIHGDRTQLSQPRRLPPNISDSSDQHWPLEWQTYPQDRQILLENWSTPCSMSYNKAHPKVLLEEIIFLVLKSVKILHFVVLLRTDQASLNICDKWNTACESFQHVQLQKQPLHTSCNKFPHSWHWVLHQKF